MHQFGLLLKRLHDHGVRFVVIGGVAASLRGSALTTMDVDVCIALDDENLFRVHAAMQGINARFRMRPDRMPIWDDPTRLIGFRNINLVTDLGQIDLLGEVTGIGTYEQVVAGSSELDVGGFVVRVMELDTLLISKRAAGRPKDQVAIMHLEATKRKQEEQK